MRKNELPDPYNSRKFSSGFDWLMTTKEYQQWLEDEEKLERQIKSFESSAEYRDENREEEK